MSAFFATLKPVYLFWATCDTSFIIAINYCTMDDIDLVRSQRFPMPTTHLWAQNSVFASTQNAATSPHRSGGLLSRGCLHTPWASATHTSTHIAALIHHFESLVRTRFDHVRFAFSFHTALASSCTGEERRGIRLEYLHFDSIPLHSVLSNSSYSVP